MRFPLVIAEAGISHQCEANITNNREEWMEVYKLDASTCIDLRLSFIDLFHIVTTIRSLLVPRNLGFVTFVTLH